MITPAVRSLFGRSFSDHKISSTRSESHISLLEPLIIPKRSLSSATLYTNDEQVSEVTSTNDLNKEEPTFTATVPRLSIETNVYKPFVLLHCIDALIKRSKEVGLMRCGRCPKTFSVYKKLEKHLKIHDRPIERLYSCNVSDCSEVFSTKCKLMTHERSHRRCKTCKKKMNLAIADFQWHESMCRGLLFNESSGRVTRSKSICIRNEENHEYDQILYKTRIELWQRADASECDIDPEEQNIALTDRRGSRKLNKNRRNSRSASVYQENQSPVIDDMSENEDFDSCFDRKSVISKVSKVSKVSKTSKASMYSQTSTKSKPISISIRSNYGIITRNDVLCKFPEAELVKFHEFFKKKQKRTRSLSINLAKIELELECRANRRSVQCDGSETGDEISMQTRKRMRRMKKNARDFTCQEENCILSFGSLNELMKHEQETHNYLPMFRCVICKACFTKKTYLITHRDMHYTETETENCPICSDIYASIEERKAHIDLHLIKTFICAFCDKEFVQESLLIKHENVFHGVFSNEVKMDVLARKILKQRPQPIEIISKHVYPKKVIQNEKRKTMKFPANGHNIIRKQCPRKQYYRTYHNKPSQFFDAKLHDDKSENSNDSFSTKDAPNYLVNYEKFDSDNSNNSPETVINHEGDKYDDFEVPKPADDTKVNFQPDDLFNYLMLTQFTNTG